MMRRIALTLLLLAAAGPAWGDIAELRKAAASLPLEPALSSDKRPDWLIDPSPYKAGAYRRAEGDEIVLSNGLVRRAFRLGPNAATVALDNLVTGQSILRGVKPEASVTVNGRRLDVGGLIGQPNYAYLLPEWLDKMTASPAAMCLVGFNVSQPTERFAWKRVRHCAGGVDWPPKGVCLRMDYAPPAGPQAKGVPAGLRVCVHYELYDHVPVLSKWITVRNDSQARLTVDRFTSETLAVVEQTNWVEAREGVAQPRPDCLHVETDFAFGGFNPENTSRHVVHWRNDPQYATQVNYLRQTPCLLVVEPTYGPAQDVEPGKTFESFRTFELLYDSTDRERRGLALRRMYRTIAPWVTENPLMHHMRIAKPQAVRAAIDQAAEVGFEMIILSFGSGFNMDNEDPAYLAAWKEIADYAHARKIEIGSYSLLSSRRVGGGNDIVCPPGQKPTHGTCPALTSEWGQKYFRRLEAFYEKTGFDLLEHDGSYPGDVDVTPRPPLQKGQNDSRWVQWRIISDFYKWCRGRGVYLNVPDFYYLAGSNKCGMGYRETNWSLPRAMQVIHTRQNVYDGTWTKTPSMGWMFVPLSQYHGGGAAATIEPLDTHLDHYRRMIDSNLGLGVQACYRGPRLFDTPRTRDMVKGRVAWFKTYRDILESDVVHGRRCDGRDLDWMLHVNPALQRKGMLVVYNPLTRPAEKPLRVNLYYTGLRDTARIRCQDGPPKDYPIDRDYGVSLPVRVEPESMIWFVIE
ncbi:MAG: hypothetical protein BWX88_03274 [Planctomycetes bacterium ADurb.Bin126]|nr:MAG: hypothetical protein BWX88_03274 [Planctomycetes bacterium ADurb.Bin126]HOD81632.1 alpha-galactosidase [Phycisphaerae bacterium]HQL71954.1 alpha-galactosidase [Phycisphaerae bacterium]